MTSMAARDIPPVLPAGRLLAWLCLVCASFLAVSGLARALLIGVGKPAPARIVASFQGSMGARRAQYVFDESGRQFLGDAFSSSALVPGDPIQIRFLPRLPQINGLDDAGSLSAGLLARWLPAVLLALAGAYLLRRCEIARDSLVRSAPAQR